MKENKMFSRRKFITDGTIGVAGIIGANSLLTGCKGDKGQKQEAQMLILPDKAPDGKPLKAGLIGCGNRGTGAAINFMDAGSNLEIVALGDIFQDKIDQCRVELNKNNQIEIPDEKCFTGFDSYEKVIDSGVDLVLLCSNPHFYPVHLRAAIDARKHVFMEKPCAVDPVGVRSVFVSAKIAEQMGLCIVCGNQRRVQKDYMETHRKVFDGTIGEIVSAHIIRNGGGAWFRSRDPRWSDMEYMLRNWQNFCWLSGDHIVEQFIHEIDIMNWFTGKLPVKAIGWGGRQRRNTGDQYDFFSVEYVYDNGMHTHCASRQISGCTNQTIQRIAGTKGFADCKGSITDLKGKPVWSYPYPGAEDTDQTWKVNNPYLQEHINLVTAIRTGEPYNNAETLANSTMVAIMGRISAYTGKDVSWDEMMNSGLSLGPKKYSFGPVPGIPEIPPVVGIAPTPAKG